MVGRILIKKLKVLLKCKPSAQYASVVSTHNIVVLGSLGVVMSGVTKVSAGEMTTYSMRAKCMHII